MMHVLGGVFARHGGEELDVGKIIIQNWDSAGRSGHDGRKFILCDRRDRSWTLFDRMTCIFD